MVLNSPTSDDFHGFRLPYGTGRVVRRVDDDGLGPLGAGGLKRLQRRLKVHVGTGKYLYRHAIRQLHGLRVAGPVRSGDDDLVTIVEQNLESLIHGLLTAVGHYYLIGAYLIAGIAQHLGRDGLAQLGQTRSGRVLVILRIKACIGSGLDHVRRSREVRLTGAKTDDVKTGGLHCLGLGIHGERSARCHSVDTVGKNLPLRHSHGSYDNPNARCLEVCCRSQQNWTSA